MGNNVIFQARSEAFSRASCIYVHLYDQTQKYETAINHRIVNASRYFRICYKDQSPRAIHIVTRCSSLFKQRICRLQQANRMSPSAIALLILHFVILVSFITAPGRRVHRESLLSRGLFHKFLSYHQMESSTGNPTLSLVC